MKIFISITIILFTTFIGKQIVSYHKRRYKYILELNKFNNINLVNLLGKKDKLIDVINLFNQSTTHEFKTTLDELKNCLQNHINFYVSNKDFNIEEREVFTQYFNSLGKNDVLAEKQTLSNFAEIFKNIEYDLKEKYIKYSNMCVKLFFLFGCLIVILII